MVLFVSVNYLTGDLYAMELGSMILIQEKVPNTIGFYQPGPPLTFSPSTGTDQIHPSSSQVN